MAEKVRPSFEQHVAKKGLPSTVAKAKEAYDAAVKKLRETPPDDAGYDKVRDAKRVAAIAMHDARSKAEAEYYAEEIAENVQAITEMKAENAEKAKKGTA